MFSNSAEYCDLRSLSAEHCDLRHLLIDERMKRETRSLSPVEFLTVHRGACSSFRILELCKWLRGYQYLRRSLRVLQQWVLRTEQLKLHLLRRHNVPEPPTPRRSRRRCAKSESPRTYLSLPGSGLTQTLALLISTSSKLFTLRKSKCPFVILLQI